MQDIDQAKSLLKQAGQEDLDVELVTSSAVGAGAVESANLFVQQAKLAGVTVRLNKADANVFYGDRYLSWNFAQDFWNTRNYIPQVAASSVKGATYNETHFEDPKFTALIDLAKREPDADRRNRLLRSAQEIEFNPGRLHHLGLQAPGRRVLEPGARPPAAPLSAVLELRVQARVVRHAPDMSMPT